MQQYKNIRSINNYPFQIKVLDPTLKNVKQRYTFLVLGHDQSCFVKNYTDYRNKQQYEIHIMTRIFI